MWFLVVLFIEVNEVKLTGAVLSPVFCASTFVAWVLCTRVGPSGGIVIPGIGDIRGLSSGLESASVESSSSSSSSHLGSVDVHGDRLIGHRLRCIGGVVSLIVLPVIVVGPPGIVVVVAPVIVLGPRVVLKEQSWCSLSEGLLERIGAIGCLGPFA